MKHQGEGKSSSITRHLGIFQVWKFAFATTNNTL